MKNKVTTCGYFLKRLRDNGFYSFRLFNNYGQTYFKRRNMTIIENNKANIQKKTYVKNIKKNISNRPSFIMGKMF